MSELYVDCSGNANSAFTNWFKHSYVLQEGDDPYEQEAFQRRFSVLDHELNETRRVANLIQHGNDFQRLMLYSPSSNGNITVSGIQEKWTNEKALFFPAKDAAIADLRRTYGVTMLRVPSSSGRVLEQVDMPDKKIEHGNVYDIRLPAFLLKMVQGEKAEQEWNAFSKEKDSSYLIQHQLFVHSGNFIPPIIPIGSFNPSIFFTSTPLPSLANNIMNHHYHSNALFCSSIIYHLVKHDIVPFIGDEVTDVHHALLGLMQQSDFGWEFFVHDFRHANGSMIVRSLQRFMNVILLFLKPPSFHPAEHVKSFVNALLPLKMKNLSIENIRLLTNPIFSTDLSLLNQFLKLESSNQIGWRIYASSVWNITVNTAFCQRLFLFLLLHIQMNDMWSSVKADAAMEWIGDLFEEVKIKLNRQKTHLLSCLRDARLVVQKMMARYEKTEGELVQLAKDRKIVHGALLDLERYRQQITDVERYAKTLDIAKTHSSKDFYLEYTEDQKKNRRKELLNDVHLEATLMKDSILDMQYTVHRDITKEEQKQLSEFNFTEEQVNLLFNI